MKKGDRMKKLASHIIGLMEALGVTFYCVFAAIIMDVLSSSSLPIENQTIFGVVFLLFFILSALITGGMVLGYPIWLFFEKKNHKEAIQVLVFAALWMIVSLVITILAIAVL